MLLLNRAESLAFQANLMYQQTFFDQAIDEKRTAIKQIKDFLV